MSSDKETKRIKAVLILEILGRPPEHLSESLKDIISKIKEEKSVEIISDKINEPKELEKQKGFYTSFAEVEVEVEEIRHLAILMFKYMPAHIEIVEPELIALTNNGWGDIFSELTRRLHSYEEVTRSLQMQLAEMQKKVKEEKNT